jgi:tetratricopeptide (TPR) repeat protein
MVASYCVTVSHLALGELARRRGAFDEALISARRAGAICRDHPERLGTGYALVRAHLLAAKANVGLGVVSEGRSELAAAQQLLRERTGYVFSWGVELNEAIVRFDCASAYAASGKFGLAMNWLEQAYDACWNDYPSIRSDPSFARMQGLPELEAFVDRCRQRELHPESYASLDTVMQS